MALDRPDKWALVLGTIFLGVIVFVLIISPRAQQQDPPPQAIRDDRPREVSVICVEGYKYVVTASGGICILGPTPVRCNP